MEEKNKIVQMRITIFFLGNIGYTPDYAKQIQSKIMPNGSIGNVVLENNMPPQINNTIPRLGGAWCIYRNPEKNNYQHIMFLPNRIDIISNNDEGYSNIEENEFINISVKWIETVIETIGGVNGLQPIRIAYAPLIIAGKGMQNDVLQKLLNLKCDKKDSITDRNITFTLKREVIINNKPIQLNLHHKISDAFQTILAANETQIKIGVLMLQLDINSIAEKEYNLENEDIKAFLQKSLELESELLNNIYE